MTDYKLNRIEDTDIFFLAKEDIKLLGETLITGTFQEVKSYAEILKQEAEFIGEGFTIVNTQDLINIDTERWYLLELLDRFQIVKTDGKNIYNLPTNISNNSGYGSLDSIFQKIETLI